MPLLLRDNVLFCLQMLSMTDLLQRMVLNNMQSVVDLNEVALGVVE